MANEYKRLDFTKLAGRKRKTVDLKEALKDETPIEWSKEVRNGSKKITVTRMN